MTERPSAGKLRVMLVDDHVLVRAAVRQAISAPDVELVAEASSAEEALDLALEARPDILLVDIDLPGMNGIEAARRAGMQSIGIARNGASLDASGAIWPSIPARRTPRAAFSKRRVGWARIRSSRPRGTRRRRAPRSGRCR